MPRAGQAIMVYVDPYWLQWLTATGTPPLHTADRGSRMGQATMPQRLLTSPPREGAEAGAGQAGQ